MKAFINYPGAKWGMAQSIIDRFPPHRSYLEPFFGSGAVLFNKTPSAIETVNDIDGEIINFFRVLKADSERLANAIEMTPYARDVFDAAYIERGDDCFDRAVSFLVRSRMGHGFKTHTKTGFKIDIHGRERSYGVSCWNATPTLLLEAAQRLKQVQIENRPAIDLIKRFNFENVLIYADPPYLPSTRCCRQYQWEMSEQDHIDLLTALLDHKGPVAISGYASELYDEMLRTWTKTTVCRYNQNHDRRVECIWQNF